MSNPEVAKITLTFRAILKRVEQFATQYADAPLFALWASAEDPSSNTDARPVCEEVVASYLRINHEYQQIDRGDVAGVGRDEWITGGMNHWRPFYAYCKPAPQLVRDELSVRMEKQFTAMSSLFASLERVISALPKRVKDRYRLPEGKPPWHEGPDWWRILFHLAIHYPSDQLRVSRHRWMNISMEVRDDTGSPISYAEKASEHSLQLKEQTPNSEEAWKGIIWCELEQDILTSTMCAIDVLIQLVEHAYVDPPKLDPASFAGILAQFEAMAAREHAAARETVSPLRLSGDGPVVSVSLPEDQSWGSRLLNVARRYASLLPMCPAPSPPSRKSQFHSVPGPVVRIVLRLSA